MEAAVEMAIAAVEESPHLSPLDQDMSPVDPDPTSLDLPLPDNRDIRHATETRAARGGDRERSLRHKDHPPPGS